MRTEAEASVGQLPALATEEAQAQRHGSLQTQGKARTMPCPEPGKEGRPSHTSTAARWDPCRVSGLQSCQTRDPCGIRLLCGRLPQQGQATSTVPRGIMVDRLRTVLWVFGGS